ncbi:MAG: Crp/Fnr family transcriptional regulator [Clostridiales bacterium]|nr:Crp/Fnr family transcriptional regulator [Clostridiales bacterium]
MNNYCNRCNKKVCASKVPIFQNLNCEELLEIENTIGHKEFSKGDTIFLEGDPANMLFFVNEGKIKLYKYNKDGKEQILHILSEGDFFGELALLKDSEHKFNSKAIDNVKICTLTKSQVKDIIMKNPQIAIKLLENVGERLSAMENLVQNLSTNDVDARIAYLLTNLMDKYSQKINNNKSIKLPISREDMANYIGVTRETISRKLKKFEEESLIKIVGIKRIIILDEKGLKNYIQ